MGRQNKVPLPYFELDCHMDDKVKLIQAEFGLKGFAVVVKLYQKIYGGEFGYYCEWDDERSLLFALENGLSGDGKNLINNIVSACTKRDIFSERLYKEYKILTSHGVQKQYLKATAKREAVEMKKEYLLINVPENRSNVEINSIYDGINAISGVRNTQSKVKKSRVENNISCAPEPHDSPADKDAQLEKDFEVIYGIYPKKRGRTGAFASYKAWVGKGKDIGGRRYRLSNRQIYLAVRKYIRQQEEAGQDDLTYWKNFDTLMGRQLLDYVDFGGDGK